MGIDSLGKTAGVTKMRQPVDRKEGLAAPNAVEGSGAAKVDLGTKRFEGIIKASTKKLSESDEARLASIKAQVKAGSYQIDPTDVARAMLEDRAFFSAIPGKDE